MTESTTPPPLPTQEPIDPTPAPRRIDDRYEQLEGKLTLLSMMEALLKTPKRLFTEIRDGNPLLITVMMLLLSVAALSIYGLITGCFSGGTQLWAAPAKIVLGVLCSGLICLPSLYIFTCLAQVDARFTDVLAFASSTLALTSVMLLGLAPVLFVFTVSTDSLAFMGVLHLVFWIIASFFGGRFLCSVFQCLRGQKGGYLTLWLTIFSFVLLQMSSTLRPIIGSSDQLIQTEKMSFLTHWGGQIWGEMEDGY